MRIISSQKYLEEEIIEQKLNNNEFEITITPTFNYDGQEFAVIINGHHTLAAAKIKGVKPVYIIASVGDHDGIILLNDNDNEKDIELFLSQYQMDSDYYYIDCGCDVW